VHTAREKGELSPDGLDLGASFSLLCAILIFPYAFADLMVGTLNNYLLTNEDGFEGID
jgi:hypothetical protein